MPEGTKLPGTLILCKLIGVNRNTLIKAFYDLEAQGFIEILPSKGVFILSGQKPAYKVKIASPKTESSPANKGFSFTKSSVLENPVETSDLPYQFNDGQPDLKLVHTDILARLYVSKLKSKRNIKVWEQQQAQSHSNFKLNFSN